MADAQEVGVAKYPFEYDNTSLFLSEKVAVDFFTYSLYFLLFMFYLYCECFDLKVIINFGHFWNFAKNYD